MNKHSNGDELTFHFIRDEPADADAFGSHERLAASIAKIIGENADLKVVGLLGPWGAGKSTVVRLVQKELEKDTSVRPHCFSYDAWLHQNDPPRRAFLETLIHFLIKAKLTDQKQWQSRLDQLNRQVEESETIATPTLTTSGRAIAFSLLLWTIGLPLVGHDWYAAAFKKDASASDFWPFALGLFLVLLPFLISVGFYLSWRPIKSPFKAGFWSWKNLYTHKAPHQDESILSLVMNKEVQRQRNRVIRSPDPTAIEFQDIFREIMDAVRSDKHRLLFVIDNLDRLPEAEAVAMWGTIRSFFLGALETKHVRKAAVMPTVILPIDETAVRRMYSVSHGAGDAEELAKSFVDKTFDLTFRVTKPVLSDWNGYLVSQMKMVFGPAMPHDWPYTTGRLYERFFLGQADPNVTPRTINTLINAIASLWLQWRDEGVSFAAVAYYCIFRERIDANILGAVATPWAGIVDLDPNWQRAIAALHYGAPPSEAAQILIEQPMRKAIVEKDAKALSALRDMPSFDRVVLRIFDQFATDGIDPLVVLGGAVMLQSLGEGEELWRSDAWRRLFAALRLSAQWRVFGAEEAEGVKALVTHCSSPDLGPLLETLNSKLGGVEPGALSDLAFVPAFVTAWSAALDASQSGLHLPHVQVPGGAEVFLSVAAASRQNSMLLKQIATAVDDPALVQELATTLPDPARAVAAEDRFLALCALGRSFDWHLLTTAATSVVRDQNANHPGTPASLLILGRLRATDKDARNQTEPLAANGQLAARLTEAYQQKRDIVVARSLALLLLSGKRDFPLPDNGNWDQRFSERPRLAELIDAALIEFDGHNNAQLLFDAAISNASLTRIVSAILALRVRNDDLGTLQLEPIITNLPQYLSCIDETQRERFIAQVAEYEKFWEILAQHTFEGPVLTLLRALIKQTDETGAKAKRALQDRLDRVDAAKWDAAIRNQGEPLAIAADFAKCAESAIEIGSNLFDALQGMIADILKRADRNLRGRWFTATAYLSSSARQTLLRNLRDSLLSAPSVQHLPALLSEGGSALLTEGGFNEKADECVRLIVLPLLPDDAGVAWLKERSAETGEWIRAAKPATSDFLLGKLNELLEGASDQPKRDALQGLKDLWSPANDSAAMEASDSAAAS